jgi:hypothetical protein
VGLDIKQLNKLYEVLMQPYEHALQQAKLRISQDGGVTIDEVFLWREATAFIAGAVFGTKGAHCNPTTYEKLKARCHHVEFADRVSINSFAVHTKPGVPDDLLEACRCGEIVVCSRHSHFNAICAECVAANFNNRSRGWFEG